jgi:2-epi-5-epi-valiolone synthase
MYRMQCAKSQSYDVLLAHDVLDSGNRALADAIGARSALVVTDHTVDALFGDRLRTYLATVDPSVDIYIADLSEQNKTISTVLDVCSATLDHRLGRRDQLIAFGGGVCTDVVALAASLVRRGIPYLSVPTTLVGQVDAGIGIKGGVHFGGSKHYLGCFTPPSRVLIDPKFLRNVAAEELRGGFAEMIKVALVLDRDFFERLVADGPELIETGFASPPGSGEAILERAIKLMLDELSENLYEDQGLERFVDFGHTFSGRLEEVSHHTLRHGQAVAIDIALTCALGTELGMLSVTDLNTVLDALQRLGLPIYTSLCTLDTALEAIEATVLHRDGALNLVVPTGLGNATFVRGPDDVGRDVLAAALERVEAASGSIVDPLLQRAGLVVRAT